MTKYAICTCDGEQIGAATLNQREAEEYLYWANKGARADEKCHYAESQERLTGAEEYNFSLLMLQLSVGI